jgi:hypothetical protein
LLGRFAARTTAECQTRRGDEFPERKTGAKKLTQLEHSASPSENSEKFLGGNFPQVVWRRVRFLQNADCWLSDAL